jgi:hypothetical protein
MDTRAFAQIPVTQERFEQYVMRILHYIYTGQSRDENTIKEMWVHLTKTYSLYCIWNQQVYRILLVHQTVSISVSRCPQIAQTLVSSHENVEIAF